MYKIITNRGEGKIKREELTPELLKGYDLVFVPFWSWKIPPSIYKNWEVVIFHMTDLPYGRGGSPLQNLIVRGHKETVISAIRCVDEIDAGPVYMKCGLNISVGTADEIYTGADWIIRNIMIPYISKTKPVPKPQEGDVVTFDKWKCRPYDVLRALDTDFEDIGQKGISKCVYS